MAGPDNRQGERTMRHPIDQADLALIAQKIAQATLFANPKVQILRGRRFGLIAQAGSLETGAFADWPLPSQFDTLDDAPQKWAIQSPMIVEAFGLQLVKISRGISEGLLTAMGDCPYARAVVLLEPADPDEDPRVIHGFDVYWDFSFSWPGSLQVCSTESFDQSWHDLFE